MAFLEKKVAIASQQVPLKGIMKIVSINSISSALNYLQELFVFKTHCLFHSTAILFNN